MKRLQLIQRWAGLVLLALLLSGCGFFASGEQPAEPTGPPVRSLTPVATFTPTTVAAQPTPISPPPTPPPLPAVAPAAAPVSAALTTTTSITPAQAVTATVAPAGAEARLIVTSDLVNIRSGPATTFDLVGTAITGETFPITAKNGQGDWWQICCVNNQPGWVFGELARVENVETVAIAADLPTPAPAAIIPTTAAGPESTPTGASAPSAPPTPPPAAASAPFGEGSAGNPDPNAQYQIVHFKVLGLNENNGGIRDSSAQHHIFLTVLDAAGNGVNGAVVRNAVGEKLDVTTGDKGPGKAEITMYWEPFKLYVVSDPSGPVTSQVSSQMGLAFPHLPDIVGKLGGLDYEYATCPTLEIKCQWPIQAVHFSYEITFQKR